VFGSRPLNLKLRLNLILSRVWPENIQCSPVENRNVGHVKNGGWISGRFFNRRDQPLLHIVGCQPAKEAQSNNSYNCEQA
jgi:hypothetical protein